MYWVYHLCHDEFGDEIYMFHILVMKSVCCLVLVMMFPYFSHDLHHLKPYF
jgi:hypothetical protein